MFPYTEILFPVDFSERARTAAPFVLSMAQRWNAKLTLLHVLQPMPTAYGGMDAVYTKPSDFTEASCELERLLEKFAAAEFPKLDVSCVVEIGDPATQIAEYARANGSQLIAMPTHGYGTFRRLLLGSVTTSVLKKTALPVWTGAHCPDPGHRVHPLPRHVLCPVDAEADSRSIIEAAAALAEDAGAKLDVVHVAVGAYAAAAASAERGSSFAAESSGAAGTRMPPTFVVADVTVADGVRDTALTRRADLIVIGRSKRHFNPGGIGSDSCDIIREAPCPVLSIS